MSRKRKKPQYYVGNTLRFLLLAGYLTVVLFPFFWILSTAVKGSQAEIYAYPVIYWPEHPSLKNFADIIRIGNFGNYFLNSFLTAGIGATGAVLVSVFAAYVLARFDFKIKGAVLFLFLFTQMIPIFISLAPQYQMLSKLGLSNTRQGLCLIYMSSMIPYSIVNLRGFFQGIPVSLEEAATIDGCTRIQALFKVVLPLIKPGIATTYIFSFINAWNDVFTANMMISSDELKTIPVALNSFILKFDIKWGELSAGVMLSIIPSVILFAFIQKYMGQGLTAGAVKG
ncbi:carbohydrate ABC transporter permease [Ruminococcus sp. 2227st1_E6_2227SCRN_220401]|uniref:carbohydrate ABC transporter permease n=1 Tax=unclassified Ruminococcus TaxID=2608920 RepID=UPI00319E0660